MDVTDEVGLSAADREQTQQEEGPRLVVRESRDEADEQREVVFDVRDLSVYYGDFRAVRNVSLPIGKNEITALIGPSGCGKTTFLRCLNRMNDLIEGARIEGELLYHGVNLYDSQVDAVEVRRRIGMVFQKPNPFPKSIYENISFGPKIAGYKGKMDDLVEESLRRAALWDEVKDKLKESGMALSGGQQQRLCIARAIADEAGRDPDGRAVLGPRPDCDATDRGPDAGARERVHDRDRHAQHAAGGPRLGPDRVLHRRGAPRDGPSHGHRRRVRQDGDDLHQPLRSTDRGLRHGAVRLMGRGHFHEELEKMELQLLTLGELAGGAVRKSVEAIVQHDDALAAEVIAGDDEIDQLYIDIDQGMISLLALQAPVAADLRLVSVIMHSACTSSGSATRRSTSRRSTSSRATCRRNATIVQQIGEMGDIVVEMVRTAMDALRLRDRDLCLQLPTMDDPVDRLNRNMHFEVAKLAGDAQALEWGMHMNLASRALERVGDNAVDIAEQVSYLLTGEFREFTDASHPGDVADDDD